MNTSMAATVHDFILSEFLPGEDPSTLGFDTELITSGILDSLATLKLVAFLEERFGVAIAPHELTPENLDSITTMVAFLQGKGARD